MLRIAVATVLITVILLTMLPATANAQGTYGQRLQGANGWLLPVASRLLGSDERDHLNRGSVNAWDLSASVGSPAWAMGPGAVEYAGCNNSGGYGCWVMIDHGGGYSATYAHCAEGSIRVQSGQQVDANTQICNVGMTGITSWPHMHLEIKHNGQRLRIDQVFNRQQMHYCFWTQCQAANAPDAPVRGAIQANGQQQAVVVTSPGQRILQAVAVAMLGMGGQLVALLFVVILAALLAFWLANNAVRVVMVCVIVCAAVSVTVAVLFMPVQTVSAGQATSQSLSGDAWEYAHDLTVGSEGWKCTNDGAYTAGGITQGTYNAWRKLKGMAAADVCQALTKAERRAIFYERYWLASGANQLPTALALTYVDHAFNAGVGAAKQGLAVCGLDARCYNNWREQSYRSMRGCSLYCAGWINRVNKFRKLEGIQ